MFRFLFWFIFLHAYKHGAGGFSYKSLQTLREPSPQAISVVNSVKLRKQNIFRIIMEEGHQIHLRHCLIHLRANGCGSQSWLSYDGWLKNVPSHLRHSQSLCFSFLCSFILNRWSPEYWHLSHFISPATIAALQMKGTVGPNTGP